MMLPFDMDWPSFAAGFFAAVIIAFVVTGLGWAGRQLGAPMRPMVVMHTTNRTPWQVGMGCASAALLLTAVAFLVAIVLASLFWGATLAEVLWMLAGAAVALVLGLLTRAMA